MKTILAILVLCLYQIGITKLLLFFLYIKIKTYICIIDINWLKVKLHRKIHKTY